MITFNFKNINKCNWNDKSFNLWLRTRVSSCSASFYSSINLYITILCYQRLLSVLITQMIYSILKKNFKHELVWKCCSDVRSKKFFNKHTFWSYKIIINTNKWSRKKWIIYINEKNTITELKIKKKNYPRASCYCNFMCLQYFNQHISVEIVTTIQLYFYQNVQQYFYAISNTILLSILFFDILKIFTIVETVWSTFIKINFLQA